MQGSGWTALEAVSLNNAGLFEASFPMAVLFEFGGTQDAGAGFKRAYI